MTPSDPDPVLAVHLRMTEWNRVLTQLGEGSINQMLGLMQRVQAQLQDQLRGDGEQGSPVARNAEAPGHAPGHALRAVPDNTQDEAS